MLAIQGLHRLEFIHWKNIKYRYLIEFGFSKNLRCFRTKKHLKFSDMKLLKVQYFFFWLRKFEDMNLLGGMIQNHLIIWLSIRLNDWPYLKYNNKNIYTLKNNRDGKEKDEITDENIKYVKKIDISLNHFFNG